MSSERPEQSFEQIVSRLEAIAKRLEAGDTQLEEALSIFEEGVALVRAGKDRLDRAEKKIEILRDSGRVEALAPPEEVPEP